MSRLMRPAGSGFLAISGAPLGYGRWPSPRRPHRRVLWRRPCRQSGCLEFLSQRSLAAGCTLPVRAEGCHHEKLPKRPHARHCLGAPLDPLRAVGAVQAGAAVGAGIVAGLYVDHHMSAHGAPSYPDYTKSCKIYTSLTHEYYAEIACGTRIGRHTAPGVLS